MNTTTTKYIYWGIIGVLAIVFIALLIKRANASNPKPQQLPPDSAPVDIETTKAGSVYDLLIVQQIKDFLKQKHTV